MTTEPDNRPEPLPYRINIEWKPDTEEKRGEIHKKLTALLNILSKQYQPVMDLISKITIVHD